MKRKLTIKMLLVAVGLFTSVSSWAENWSVDFATIAKGGSDKQGVTISTTAVTIDGTTMGTASLGETGINSNFVFQTGTSWLGRTAGRFQHADGSGKSFGIRNCTKDQTITLVTGNATINSAYNATLQSSSDGTYVYKVTNDGDVKFSHARYIYLFSVEVTDPSASAVNYTIKYQDGSGNTLKDDVVYMGEPGEVPTVNSTDKAYITKDDTRYVYSSDNASSQTIASDGSTVVIVTFRVANTFTYSVKAVDGSDNDLFSLSSGSYLEGDDAVKVAFPRFYMSGTTLLSSGEGTVSYTTSFTPDDNDYVKKVTYNSGTVSNVAFYTEGEDVSGASEGTNEARASKGKMGYTGSADTYLDVTTLAPGKYTIYMRTQNGNKDARAYNFKVGDDVVFTGSFANGTNTDANSTEFTVTESATLSFASEGSNASGIDYFYLVQSDIAIREAIAECKKYETSTAFATYIEAQYAAGSLTTAAEVYAAHTAWQVAQAKASGSTDYSAVILNHAVTSTDRYWGNLTEGASYDGAPDNYYLAWTAGEAYNVNNQVYGVPAGQYEVSAYTYSSTADERNLYIAIIEPWGDINGANTVTTAGWAKNTTTISLSAQNNLAFGFYAAAATDRIAGFDNWTMTLKGVYVDVSNEYATLVSPYALDFTDTTIKAYTAKVNTATGNVVLTKINKVPANTPVVLYAEGGATGYIPVNTGESDTPAASDLCVGSDAAVATGDSPYNYILNIVDEQIGFYKSAGQTVASDRAYLQTTFNAAEAGARMAIVFADDATSVKAIENSTLNMQNICDLQGRRVAKPTKGLYVVNGKKVVIK